MKIKKKYAKSTNINTPTCKSDELIESIMVKFLSMIDCVTRVRKDKPTI